MTPALAPAANIRTDGRGQIRYAARAAQNLEDLARHHSLPDEASARRLLEPRLAPLREAFGRSPYYLRALRERGLTPRDLRDFDALAAFPTLDRATLHAHWRELPAFDPLGSTAQEIVRVFSSGTTGNPVPVIKDTYDCLYQWVALKYWLRVLDIDLSAQPVSALLCNLPSGMEYESAVPLLGQGRMVRISTRRPEPLRRLEAANPEILFSDPAGLHWLLQHEPRIRPRAVLSSAQHLGSAERAALTDAWSAPVIDYYSTTETGPIAWQCPGSASIFHVLAPDVFVESLGGEIAVTRLRPSVLPILRYLPGDMGKVFFGPCACGFSGWNIGSLSGRGRCDFVTPGGERFDAWTLAWVFKHFALDDFTLEQTSPSAFRVTVLGLEAAAASALAATLSGALRLQGIPEPHLDIVAQPVSDAAVKPEPFRARFARPPTPELPQDARK